MRPGERHFYRIPAQRGGVLEGEITVEGIGLSLVLRDSAGHVLLSLENLGRRMGPLLFAPPTSDLSLAISAQAYQGTLGGRYRIRFNPSREPTQDDRRRATAVQHLSRGHQHYWNNHLEAALREYRTALEGWLPEEHWETGTTLYWLGHNEYKREAFPLSHAYLGRASRELNLGGDRAGEALATKDDGNALLKLKRLPEALERHGRAAELFEALGDRAQQAAALTGKALAFKMQNNFKEALRIDETALALTVPGQGGVRKTILHNLGQICLDMARPEDAITWLTQALKEPSPTSEQDFSRLTLSALASAYFSVQEPEKSLLYLRQALRPPASAPYRTMALLHQASILLQLARSDPRRIPEAMAAAGEAQQIAQAEGDGQIEGFATSIYGWALEFQGRSGEALQLFAKARPLIEKSGDKNASSGVLFGVAHAEKNLGHLERAKQAIEKSLALIEDVRAGTSSLEMRSSFLNQSRSRYEFYIDLLMELSNQGPHRGYDVLAFEASERARARAVLDEISEARANLEKQADSRLTEEEAALRKEIQKAEDMRQELLSRRGDMADRWKADRLDQRISELSAQYDLTLAALRSSSPLAEDPQRTRPRKLREIQSGLLDGDTILLSYWLGEKRSYLWRVDRSSLSSYVLPPRSSIEPLAIKLRDSLGRGLMTIGRQEAVKAVANLGKILLRPVSGRLAFSRLLILADGVLQYVPFDALSIPDAEGARSANDWPDRPLILDHEIERIPSASALALLRRERAGRRPPPHQLATLANPKFKPEPLGPPSLPGSEREARGILSLVPPGESLAALGYDASLKTATSPALGDYQMIHFATHAVLRERSSLSGLILSQLDAQGREQPSFLPALEIYNLKLPVDLVVLSACQTARGEDKGGEGIGSLTRSFLYAGSRSVVVTLWSVSDEPTAILMERFYTGLLRAGLSPSEALRRAKLSIRAVDRWSSPYYWAPFVLQGDGGDPIVPNKTPAPVSYSVSRRARHHPGAEPVGPPA